MKQANYSIAHSRVRQTDLRYLLSSSSVMSVYLYQAREFINRNSTVCHYFAVCQCECRICSLSREWMCEAADGKVRQRCAKIKRVLSAFTKLWLNQWLINTNWGFSAAGKVSPNYTQQTELGDWLWVHPVAAQIPDKAGGERPGFAAAELCDPPPCSSPQRTFNSSFRTRCAARAKRHTETTKPKNERMNQMKWMKLLENQT